MLIASSRNRFSREPSVATYYKNASQVSIIDTGRLKSQVQDMTYVKNVVSIVHTVYTRLKELRHT